MTEKQLELKLKKEVEKLDGLCLKLVTPGFTGILDRLIILPGGKVWFVEVKKETGILSFRQRKVKQQLRNLNLNAEVIKNEMDLKVLLKMLVDDL